MAAAGKRLTTSIAADWRFQNLLHLYPGIKIPIGIFGFFVIKITVIRQVRKDVVKRRKTREDRGHILLTVCSCVCDRQNPAALEFYG